MPVTEQYAADWKMEQLWKSAQYIADQIDDWVGTVASAVGA